MAAPVALQLKNVDIVGSSPPGGGGGPKSPTTPTSPLTAKVPSPFVNLNVRQVFESNGVDDTKEISKRVNLEIEKKREELRTLVGERYRDLIDAADTIALMNTNSASIVGKLGSLRQRMSTIPTQLNALPRPQNPEDHRSILNKTELEVAFELKLSLEAPRVVQRLLDDHQVIQAAHVGILFEKSLSPGGKPYTWSFLGGKSEETSGAIKDLILNTCDKVIQDFSSPPEKVAECLAVQQVLKLSSCSEVITSMLSSRMSLCDAILDSGDDSNFVQSVASTLHNIYVMFIDGQLYSLAAKEVRRPTINVSSFGVKYTPKVVEMFEKSSVPVEESPRAGVLAEILLSSFVQPLKTILSKSFEANKYLTSEESFEDLSNYAKATIDLLKGQTDDLMRIVLGTSRTLWGEVFYPVFQQKCEQVGRQKISLFFQFLAEETFPKFKKLDDDFDLVSYIWKGSSTKFPGAYSSQDVDLKLKCVSPQVAEICDQVEIGFGEFLRDFQTLADFSLKKFVSSEILKNWREFLTGVVENGGETLFLARFTGSLEGLAPSLWKLIDIKDAAELRQKFSEIGGNCWKKWAISRGESFLHELSSKMDLEGFSSFIPAGEEFVGEGEEGVKPSVRIPIQISHHLHSSLFGVCKNLSSVGPQSIPKQVREEFRHLIGCKIVSLYDNCLSQAPAGLSPQSALQLIFDLKFCQWFHLQLKDQADPVLKQLEAKIDPFDLDIVGGKVKTNLKRFLFETHLTLGLLFSEESHSFIAQNFKTKINLPFPVSNPALASPLPLLPV